MLNINELNTAKKEIKSKKDKEKLEPVIDLSIDAWSDFRDDDEGEVVTQSGLIKELKMIIVLNYNFVTQNHVTKIHVTINHVLIN